MPRPLSFDPEKTLSKIMLYFWREGYRGTSINDLSQTFGISKFSLYQQYGNKESLFEKSISKYQQKVYRPLIAPLREEKGLQAIQNYLDNLETGLSQDQAEMGCLLNNTIVNAHSIPKNCVEHALGATKELRYLLKKNFQIAQDKGEIKCAYQSCLNFTLMNVQALIQTRKTLGYTKTPQNC